MAHPRDIVDAHVHVVPEAIEHRTVLDSIEHPTIGDTWYEAPGLSIDGLRTAMESAAVPYAVLVQAVTACGYDNSYVIQASEVEPDRLWPVGAVDPADPRAPATMRQLASDKGVRGIRLFSLARPTGAFVLGLPQLWETARRLGITLSLQIPEPSPEWLHPLLQAYPDVPVVLEHLAMGGLASLDLRTVREHLGAVGVYKQLFVKMTNMNFAAVGGNRRATGDLVREIVRAVGPYRIVWGSNYPATVAEGGYADLVKSAMQSVASLPAGAQAAILGANARRLWGHSA